MSLGLLEAGFQVLVGVDSDREALETHSHHFPGRSIELDLADPRAIGRTVRLLKGIDVDLIAGGPPCQPFSRAGKSWINELVRRGQRKARDERRTLWRSFTEIVGGVRPRAVLMENVPEMALDRDVGILREIVHVLEQAGYSVEARLVDAWRYGVPQFRQRLIVVALRDHLAFDWPPEATQRVKLGDAITDLPCVEGGWRPEGGADGFVEYDGPRTTFQKRMRRDIPAEQATRIYDHITRPVRPDDAEAFQLMDTTTLYSELPAHLKRYRDDVHDDRYKRLDFNDLSRTITAHIAKDGYWYIHPEQHRTLTVREAARIQTFPDHVRFAGPPSTAFRQIGNAVPPALAEHLAHAIRRALEHPKRRQGPSTKDTQAGLAEWIVERSRLGQVGVPWHDLSIVSLAKGRRPPMTLRWLAVVAEVLLDRVPVDSMVRDRLWPVVRTHLGKPSSALQNATLLQQLAHGVRREARAQVLLDAAGAVAERPETLATIDQLASLPGITQAMAAVVARLVPGKGEDAVAVTVGLLRVAARYGGTDVDTLNRLSSGRLEIARLIGVEPRSSGKRTTPLTASLAHIALFEIAERVCTVARPVCDQCPLSARCVSRDGFERPLVGQQQLAFA